MLDKIGIESCSIARYDRDGSKTTENTEIKEYQMRELEEIRNDIDAVDSEILRLYEERLNLANEVAEYKIANRKPVFDKQREAAKLKRLSEQASDEFSRQGVSELFEQIMAGSRKKQYRILAEHGMMGPLHFRGVDALDFTGKTVVFQGVPGAYSQAAMLRFFGDKVQSFPVDTWRNAMETIRTGMADFAVLPIENSTAGAVNENYDLLMEYDVSIVGEQIIPIDHCLLGVSGAAKEEIKTVYSHPQALMQCEEYLRFTHPEYEAVALDNTAMAAMKVRDDADKTQAAIAGRINAELYGLSILDESIEDDKNNETRFVIVAAEKIYLKTAKTVSVCLELPNDKGSLYHTLSHFIFNGLSMSRIESRPIKGRVWQYRFFIDFEGNLQDEDVLNALRGLQEETISLRILGNY